MGRGLSELQKRILIHARDRQNPYFIGAEWFDHIAAGHKRQLCETILPGKWGRWTNSDTVSMSRALRRLEMRGLIIRHRGKRIKRRTQRIVLTPAGEAALELIGAGKPVPSSVDRQPPPKPGSSVRKIPPHCRPIPPGWRESGRPGPDPVGDVENTSPPRETISARLAREYPEIAAKLDARDGR